MLKTQAELALREFECGRGDPDALREIVQGIAATTDATVHLANRLLTLARIEHGGGTAGMAPLSLRAIAQQVGLELAPAAVARQIDLSLEAGLDALVSGQALLLHELVPNLVDNALRYTPAGGSVSLRVRAQAGAAGALLEVEDSGGGHRTRRTRARIRAVLPRCGRARRQSGRRRAGPGNRARYC